MGFREFLAEHDKKEKAKFIPFEKKAELIAKLPVKKVKVVSQKPYSIVEHAMEILDDESGFDVSKAPTKKEVEELDHADALMG